MNKNMAKGPALFSGLMGLICLASLASISIADANDSTAAIGAGGIEFIENDVVAMISEELYISTEKVRVNYIFDNPSDKDVETIVTFPLPPFTCAEFGTNRAISGFHAWINGSKIRTKTEIKAIEYTGQVGKPLKYGTGKDISKKVLDKGLPLSCLEVTNDPQLMKKAQKAGLAANFDGGGPNSEPTDVLYQTEVKYCWTQTFPARSKTRIEHEYRPLVGMYVGGIRDQHKSLNFSKDIEPDSMRGYTTVKYILTTANNWAKPIKMFKLTVDSKNKGLLLGSSLGPLKPAGESKFEVTRTDFKPEADLVALIEVPNR